MTMRSVGSRVSVFAGVLFLTMAAVPAAGQQSDPIGQGLAAAIKNAAKTAATPSLAVETQDPAAPADNPVLKFFANTEVTGFVDTYYHYNFNKASEPCYTVGGVDVSTCLHNFEVAHNAFSLNLAEIALEKKPTAESRGGFRIDLDYGPTAALVHGFEPGGVQVWQNVEQAYLSYLAPTSKGSLQFDFGKFVTQHGAEVIETKDNWNYSRSLLFSLAIPYYHMGVRVMYSPNDKVTLMGDLTNGWNNAVDNNTGKTVGFQGLFKPNSATSIIANYMGGPEQTDNNDDWRHLFDATITYTVSPQVSLIANYDYGHESFGSSSQTWQGIAGYLKYQPNSWFALVPRYEFLNDKDGWAFIGQNVQEFTLTAELKHKDGVMMRVEYRGDFADDPFFPQNSHELKKNQQVLTIGWIYSFSSKAP